MPAYFFYGYLMWLGRPRTRLNIYKRGSRVCFLGGTLVNQGYLLCELCQTSVRARIVAIAESCLVAFAVSLFRNNNCSLLRILEYSLFTNYISIELKYFHYKFWQGYDYLIRYGTSYRLQDNIVTIWRTRKAR